MEAADESPVKVANNVINQKGVHEENTTHVTTITGTFSSVF
jgi:hypothetical protein